MSAPLWTLTKVKEAIGGTLKGAPDAAFSGVTFDSRDVRGGEIFFAIEGIRMDGHQFAARALKAGAGLAVVSAPDKEMARAGALLVVPDTLRALQDLGRAGRARAAAKVIGVTGSVGKTTTKDMMALAFAAVGETHAAKASFNNHWGVPLTLARLPGDARYAIVEMGMNAPGEIAALTRMARPHVAVVTQIAESHIGAFGDLAGIARAKAEIFGGLEPGGAAVLNRDMPHFSILAEAAKAAGAEQIITFGHEKGADVRLERAVNTDTGVSVEAVARGRALVWRIGMPGLHVAENSLAVIGAALALEADLTAVIHSLAAMKPPKGRGGRIRLSAPGGDILLIDESYNANPASVRAALASLAAARPGPGGRRIAVLGDMLELGEAGPDMHAALAKDVEEAGVDALYVAGPLMTYLWEAAPARLRAARTETSGALPEILKRDLRGGDVVMIKGSLGSKMGPVAAALTGMFEPSSSEA